MNQSISMLFLCVCLDCKANVSFVDELLVVANILSRFTSELPKVKTFWCKLLKIEEILLVIDIC